MRALTNTPYPTIKSIAVIGNYLPRKCGIATFTTDLVTSILSDNPSRRCAAIAMNDRPEGYEYPREVRFEINQNRLENYHAATNFLNLYRPDVVSLQHEFGIYGGKAGDYILTVLEELQMPVVTTLHTVLTEPTRTQRSVMNQLDELSQQFVVMSKKAVNMLHTIYDVPKEKISFIPHGIPDTSFVDSNYYKAKFDLLGRKTLLTFGLLSKNKGVDYVIKALPRVIERFPDLSYIILGATHPNVLALEGEAYRNQLKQLVQKFDLEDHVIFENRFVSKGELCEYLAATDVYITPYNNKNQITSGTLAYAMGFGKPVISTPYWYAEEMLSDERGLLVPFKNDEAISDAVIKLVSDDILRLKMSKRAYDFNRHATWRAVARQYLDVFQQVKSEHCRELCTYAAFSTNLPTNGTPMKDKPLPALKFDHLFTLTDDCGILQHANYIIPNRSEGYCTDDNARALIVAIQAQNLSFVGEEDQARIEKLTSRYLAFLKHAYNPETGRFRNFMNYSRQWVEKAGSEDAHSRAIWALGATIALSRQRALLSLTTSLFTRALKATESFHSPRSIAFALVGIGDYLKVFEGDSQVRRTARILAERLFHQFLTNAGDDWPWPENILAYSNGKLPQALLLAANILQNDEMKQMGARTLEWLLQIQTEDGHLVPIGNDGWFNRNEEKARFDQQPLEVNALLEACVAAFNATDDEQWLDKARTCFNWFLGSNDLNLPLYDSQSGGCCDGLEMNCVNQNEGAESTLAWLLSLMTMYQLSDEKAFERNYNWIDY